jgi:monofunctional glycosyltransferase
MKKVRRILVTLLLLFFSSSVFFTLLYKWVPVYVSPLMVIRCIQQASQGKEVVNNHIWVPIEEISPHLSTAVMASEDQKFLDHNGFDKAAIKAAAKDYIDGKRKRGGSTISQQTAKNVFLWPNSSWIRKGFETYFTFLIELFWSKERIMEVYLNTIEMGDGIYGAQAVALANFGVNASELTRRQCALIAATLPNPLKFSSKNPSPYMKKRQRQILHEMDYIQHLKETHNWLTGK